MKLNISGRDIEIYPEPTVRTVEMVVAYDEKLTQDRLKQYIPDLSDLSEEDKKKEINQLIRERTQKDPEMMTSFASKLEHIQKRRAIEEQVKTIMLVTGMTPAEIIDMPLKTLYMKCHEVLGGTAGDFFAELQTSLDSKPIPTRSQS
jgi:hypothetical protein